MVLIFNSHLPPNNNNNTHTRTSILTNFINNINDTFKKLDSSKKQSATNKLLLSLTDTLFDKHSSIFEAVYTTQASNIYRAYEDREKVNLIRNFPGNGNIARLFMDFDVKQLGRLSITVDCTKDTDNVFITKIGGGYNKPVQVFSSPTVDPSEIASFTSQAISVIRS